MGSGSYTNERSVERVFRMEWEWYSKWHRVGFDSVRSMISSHCWRFLCKRLKSLLDRRSQFVREENTAWLMPLRESGVRIQKPRDRSEEAEVGVGRDQPAPCICHLDSHFFLHIRHFRFLLRLPIALVMVQIFRAESDRLRRHFDILVIADPFDRLLERKNTGRFQAYRFIRA